MSKNKSETLEGMMDDESTGKRVECTKNHLVAKREANGMLVIKCHRCGHFVTVAINKNGGFHINND